MPITLPAQRLAFFFLPKVACTSFKHMFFEIENGRPFEPFQVNGKRQFVHDLYPFRRFAKLKPAQYEGFARLALLRDPVARVVSCYRNRVVAQKALALGDTPARLAAQGLSAKPSLEEFVAHFPAYRRASGAVRFHTQPLSHALGPDPGWFTKLYRFSEIAAAATEIRRITGTDVALPHLQTRGPTMGVRDLSPEGQASLKTHFAEDYTLWGPWL